MKPSPLPLVIALAALGLQACDQEPARTTVSPPQASLPDDASLRQPAAPPLDTAQAPAPAASAETAASPAPAATTAQSTQPTTSGDNPVPPAEVAAAEASASAPVAVTSPTPEPPAPPTTAMGAQPAAAAETTPPGVAAPTELSRFFEPAQPAVATSSPPVAAPAAAAPAASATKPPAQDKVSANLPSVRDAGDPEGARLLAQRTLQVPVAGIPPTALSDMYEQTRGSRKHEAIDILAPLGTPVVAVDDGRIAKLFNSKPGGLTVYQFDPEARLAYYYAHLQRYADVREGMDVKRGDLLGYVGVSGNADVNSPHLHFAVFKLGTPPRWWEGAPVNPYPALSRAQPTANQVATR